MKTDVYLIIYQLGKIAGKVWTITKISSFISVKVLDCRHFAILLQFSEDVAFPVTFIPNGESLFGWKRMINIECYEGRVPVVGILNVWMCVVTVSSTCLSRPTLSLALHLLVPLKEWGSPPCTVFSSHASVDNLWHC